VLHQQHETAPAGTPCSSASHHVLHFTHTPLTMAGRAAAGICGRCMACCCCWLVPAPVCPGLCRGCRGCPGRCRGCRVDAPGGAGGGAKPPGLPAGCCMGRCAEFPPAGGLKGGSPCAGLCCCAGGAGGVSCTPPVPGLCSCCCCCGFCCCAGAAGGAAAGEAPAGRCSGGRGRCAPGPGGGIAGRCNPAADEPFGGAAGGAAGLIGPGAMLGLCGRGIRLGTGPFCPGVAGLFTVPGAPGPVASVACAIKRLPRMDGTAIAALALQCELQRVDCCSCGVICLMCKDVLSAQRSTQLLSTWQQ